MESGKTRPGNYLSMDGGDDWISALPALLTLEEITKRLQRDLDLPETPLPCKVFDVIIASSHAAVAALLVGKMHMTPSQAMDAYKKLEPTLSLGPTEDEEERERNMEAFRKAFTEILEENGFDEHSLMLCKEQKETGAKTVICTQNAANLPSLHLIRSYLVRGARPAECTILQAACASIASPDRFPPVIIGSGHKRVSLINAIPDYPNPTKVLLTEARRIFGDKENVAAIVSIGSGKRVVLGGLESTDDEVLVDKKDSITFKCEQVHEDVLARLQELFIYFRFNYNQSPEDMTDDFSINTLMSAYFQQEETTKYLDNAVESMRARQPGGNLLDINMVDKNEIKLKPRPSVALNFVGREDILKAMRERHFGGRSSQTRMPAITILSGLGGSGKTQIACKFADEFEAQCPDIPVYFLDASSEDNLKADLETAIRSQGTISRSQSCEDALAWLGAKARKWCLILDNADDPSLNLFPYIPKSSQGNVIITTRNSTHALLAPDDHHTIEGLPMTDAVDLVLKMAHYEAATENQLLAQAIVKELGSLPLALAHAAGYIFVHQCLPNYLAMYRASQAKFLDSNQALPQDYQLSVATTVEMSLSKLPPTARDMMRIFSHLEVSSIPLQLISLSAERLFRVIAGKVDGETVDEQTIQQADILMAIFCPDGEWFELDFNTSIQKCLEYSLLQITTQDDDRFFSMHVLVQTHLKYSLGTIWHHKTEQLVARLLGSAITIDRRFKSHAFDRLLVPHLRLLRVDHVIEAGDHLGFGAILMDQGNASLATEHHEWCLALRMSTLNDADPGTVDAMRSLAGSYTGLGRHQDALDIQEWALEAHMRISGDDDPETVRMMANIATYYYNLGRYQDALETQEKVLELQIQILGDEHPYTWSAMSNLAAFYSAMGRYRDALKIQEKVLKLRGQLLGDEHPDTLVAMGNLARSYSRLERDREALDIEERVLELRRQISGDEHPDTLGAMGNLAVSYCRLGRNQEALEIEEKVLRLRTQISGDEHPDTLVAMANLSTPYDQLGRYQEALDIRERVLELRTRISGDEHPDTLVAMGNLALSYSRLGRYQKALDVEEKVLEHRRRILGDEHPDTWLAMGNLAVSYSELRRHEDALDLKKEVLEIQTKILGGGHPKTMYSIGNLAVSYSELERYQDALDIEKKMLGFYTPIVADDHPIIPVIMAAIATSYGGLGRYQDALDTREKVLELQIRISGDEHPNTLGAMGNLAVSYRQLGRNHESLDIQERALELWRRISGDEHPDTRVAMGNLAASYHELGRYQEALDLQEKVLELQTRISGNDHPDTLLAMGNLAASYSNLGRNKEALDVEEKVLESRTRISGDEHPATLVAMGNLAASYCELGRYQEALEIQDKALELRTRISGDEHPETLVAMGNLAASYCELGRYQEALEIQNKALELRTRISGDEHPETLVAMGNLAASYGELGRYQEALEIQDKTLELRTRISGDEHPATLVAMGNLAASYCELGRYQEALEIQEKTLELRTRILGDEHPNTLQTMSHLARSYTGLGRYRDALDLEEKVLKLRTQISGDEHPDTLRAMGNLASSYNDLGRHQDALDLEEKVLALRKQIFEDHHPATLLAMRNLGRTLEKAGMKERAISLLHAALPLHEKFQGANHPDTIYVQELIEDLMESSDDEVYFSCDEGFVDQYNEEEVVQGTEMTSGGI